MTPKPVRLAWYVFAGACATGAFLLPWRAHWPGYFPGLDLHRWLGWGTALLGPLALAWHLVRTRSRAWMVGTVLVLGGIASLPVVAALDFPRPASFVDRQLDAVRLLLDAATSSPSFLEALGDRVQSRLLPTPGTELPFYDLLGSVVLLSLLLAAAALTLFGIATRARERSASRWSGSALTLLATWALAGGAVLQIQPRESVFGALTLHSVAGAGTVALLVLHAIVRRVADRGWTRGALMAVGALWMLGSSGLWAAHYDAEHLAGYRPGDVERVFATASTPATRQERVDATAPGSGRATLPAEDLSASLSCGETGCHPSITEEWAGSPHRYSADNALYRAAVGEAVAAQGVQMAAFCANCHDPVRALSGSVGSDYADGAPPPGSEGVSCVVCHGMVSVVQDVDGSPPSNGRFTVAADRPYPGRGATQRARIRSDPRRHRQAMVTQGVTLSGTPCRVCHRVEIGPDVGAAHRSVAQHPRAPGGGLDGAQELNCSLCHLPQDAAATYTHRMAGIDVDLPAYALAGTPQDAERVRRHAQAARDFVGLRPWGPIDGEGWPAAVPPAATLEGHHRSSASGVIDLELSVAEGTDSGSIELALRTRNLGVGHQFPSGPFDLQEAWLELYVADAAGRVLGHDGALEADGSIGGDPLRLGGRELRDDGSPVPKHRIWELAGVTDERLLDGALRRDRRTVALPPGATRPLDVRARWLFRRANPAFTRWAMDGAVLPAWEVASARLTVD